MCQAEYRVLGNQEPCLQVSHSQRDKIMTYTRGQRPGPTLYTEDHKHLPEQAFLEERIQGHDIQLLSLGRGGEGSAVPWRRHTGNRQEPLKAWSLGGM